MLKIGVLVSGRGSNLQALIDAIECGEIEGKIAVVISSKRDAYALERAKKHSIDTAFVEARGRPREQVDAEVDSILSSHGVELVVLAGYMRILTPGFVHKWLGKMINIHPALLPSFPGKEAQKQALDYGAKVSGCTVHFVDEGVDTGPIIMQRCVPVLDDDDVEKLSARILEEEHKALPEAVRLYASGRIIVEGRKVRIEK